MLNHAEIQSRIPHAAAMCLLESVQGWDATSIDCSAAAPTAAHPLANARGVPAVAAIEYAAQAVAVHGALLAPTDAPRAGMLAKLSGVELSPTGPDPAGGALTIRAELLAHVDAGCQYAFEVSNQRGRLARGRLTVAFSP